MSFEVWAKNSRAGRQRLVYFLTRKSEWQNFENLKNGVRYLQKLEGAMQTRSGKVKGRIADSK
ncbi:hypothetical protein FC47_GL000211 [Limosilactobacillus mucosae DSM 13345]|jgi:hypothetical protein|uniref:Uncharacterized protein n=1 Tax=Limosilactobacillus mucosae DSM 13345 TaxID=1423771 RepID=A0A0R1P0B6_LIMMU|nr:hypothetical protein FC47_GL000211 [Limosilactobacillus mucosae DSM 13345]